jgi:NAD dependent epimerase/dehydratase family enzyme
MRRPSWAPVPGFVLKLIVGELAEVALLRGQRVLPARAEELGFAFRYPELKSALAAIFERGHSSRL